MIRGVGELFRVLFSPFYNFAGNLVNAAFSVILRSKHPEGFIFLNVSTMEPDHCFIIDDDISAMPIPDELDKQYYIDWAWDRLIDFGVKR